DPATQKHLAAAAAALERADKAALYMKRGGAVSSARQAIAELDEALARFVAPRKLARAHAALAYALLLAPADEVGARDALHAAVTADANFTPDADRNSPTVKRLLAEARAKLRVAPPDSASLDKLASRARLARLVWLSAAAAAGGASTVDLEVQIYEVSARAVRTRLSKRVTRAELVASAAALVEQALAGDKAIAGGTGSGGAGSGNGGAGPAGTPGGGAAASATPWYKRWWIWAIAGAVVAGAGVGLGVGLTRGDGGSTTPPPNPNGFDIIFRH
ncbi:MAG: hypothetical protein KC503_28900, partial [Myxococcales bacterium]|nr:hypothetical protein [Myxococcales bacterium]